MVLKTVKECKMEKKFMQQKIQEISQMIQTLKRGERTVVEKFHYKVGLSKIGEKGDGLLVKAQTLREKSQNEEGIVFFDGEKQYLSVGNEFEVIYYPKPEESLLFARSADTRMGAGPGTYFPGAVGSANCTIFPKARAGDFFTLEIGYIQGHFKIGEPVELDAKRVRKYGGWKRRIIEYIFQVATESSVEAVIFNNKFKGEIKRDFENYCAENGIEFCADIVIENAHSGISRRLESAILDKTIDREKLLS